MKKIFSFLALMFSVFQLFSASADFQITAVKPHVHDPLEDDLVCNVEIVNFYTYPEDSEKGSLATDGKEFLIDSNDIEKKSGNDNCELFQIYVKSNKPVMLNVELEGGVEPLDENHNLSEFIIEKGIKYFLYGYYGSEASGDNADKDNKTAKNGSPIKISVELKNATETAVFAVKIGYGGGVKDDTIIGDFRLPITVNVYATVEEEK